MTDEKLWWKPDAVPNPDDETYEELRGRLTELILDGYNAGMELGDWLQSALEDAATQVPKGVEGLLRQRPGSWEADCIRKLAGSPSYLEQRHDEED